MSHHVSFNDLPQGGEKFEPAKGGKLIGALGLFGVLGLAASAFFFFKNTDTFAYSWLFAKTSRTWSSSSACSPARCSFRP
jgi:hypothetical protein